MPFPIATTAGGIAQGFPDTCLVPAPPAPPVPTPFPNVGMLAQTNRATCSQKVKILNMPALVQNSAIPMSSGDEAGSAGGVVSGMIKGQVSFKTGHAKVSLEGKKVIYLTAPSAHNGTNANCPAGVVVAPSQAKVFVGP